MSEVLRVGSHGAAQLGLRVFGCVAIEFGHGRTRPICNFLGQDARRVCRSDDRCLVVQCALAHAAHDDRPVEARSWLRGRLTFEREPAERVARKPLIQLTVGIVPDEALRSPISVLDIAAAA